MLQEPPLPESELVEQCANASTTAASLNRATNLWHCSLSSGVGWLMQLHQANFDLWHLEDKARDPHAGSATIAQVKREIDRVNQQRNDTVEQIDVILLETLSTRGLPAAEAPLHSETPGQIFDRLSILSLKIFHTALEAERLQADDAHRARNRSRLTSLQEQQTDLAHCLEQLWCEVLAGHRRIKLYKQYKMYNDPALNPILYRNRK